MAPNISQSVPQLKSLHLLLRPWQASDLAPFAALNADPQVMRYFPAPLSREESDRLATDIQARLSAQGWGLWAVSVLKGDSFIGFVGLNIPTDNLPCNPCVEIGWRLAAAHWGQGYATEAAALVARYAFRQLHLQEIVAFTAEINRPSRRVMEKIGMCHHDEYFDHPALPTDSPLRRHVLYRLRHSPPL